MDEQRIDEFINLAAARNDTTKIESMLQETPLLLNEKDEFGITALMRASYEGHTSLVQLLLEKGANPNQRNNEGATALMVASYEGHSSIAQLLLDNGSDIDIQNADGSTALMAASYDGRTPIVELLLDKGANPNVQNQLGITALMGASSEGHASIVRLLLEKGAHPDTKNKHGRTALDLAKDERSRILLTQALKQYTREHTVPTSTCTLIKSRDVSVSTRLCFSVLSSVYRGKYRGTDVAIKMLRGDGATRISSAELREIEISSNLRHPRIVSLLGVILDLKKHYEAAVGLVTEFMPRGSLYDVLHLKTTPPEHRLTTLSSKLRVLRDVADGMRFLHMSNVIHRDLKSPNVLLDEDGRAKICDFGVTKILPPNISYATAAVGTPAWSSPESLVDNGTVRQSTDVYSFGVILWEILTGSIPWSGLSASAIIVKVSHGKSLPLDAVPAIPENTGELNAMMQQCLASNPEHRPTFEHIVQCLSELLPACIEREGRVPCPNAYLCPISYEIMEDPVICSDGHTYDRVNIELWLQRNDTSPLTNAILEDKTLRPNIVLRGLIQEFKELHV